MKWNLLLFIILLSLTSHINSSDVKYHRFRNILEIVVIKLPHDLSTDIAITSEAEFDDCGVKTDTLRIDIDKYKLKLGTDKYQTKSLDLRTKIIVCFRDGSKTVFLMNRFGSILFKGKIYSGSIDVLNFFRGEKIEQ